MTAEPSTGSRQITSRFTLASIYLAAGLVVCYLVLTRLIPLMREIADNRGRHRPGDGGWPAFTLELSAWVQTHLALSCSIGVPLIAAGFILPILWKPGRYLVWLLALGVFLLDVALAAGGYWQMLSSLLKEANNPGH